MGTVSDATYSIRVPIYKKKANLLGFTVPNTLYNINTTNNTLIFTVSGNTYTVSIPPGAYNSASFLQAVQTAMSSAGSGLNFTVTQNNNTFLITIASTASFTMRSGTTNVQ